MLAADWNTFNGKQAAGNYITALTGDGTASGPGSSVLTLATVNANVGTFASVTVNGKGLTTAAANLSGDITTSGSVSTLATVNSNVGSFGSNTGIASFTVNGKGLITAASNNSVITAAAASTVSAWDANKNLSANNSLLGFQSIATAAATTNITVSSPYQTLFTGVTTQTVSMTAVANVALGTSFFINNASTGVVTVQSSGGGTIQAMATNTCLYLTSNATSGGAIGTWNAIYGTTNGTVPIALGGTGKTTATTAFNALSPMTTGGDVIYGGASGVGTRLANGSSGQFLTSGGGTAAPSWTTATFPGATYYTGSFPGSSANYWSLTSATLANFTPNGTIPSPTSRQGNGFTVNGAASSLPGISFTAPRTGVIQIICTAIVIPGQVVGANSGVLSLLESATATTIIDGSINISANNANNFAGPITLTGYFSATSATAYTFVLKGAIGSGTLFIGANATGVSCLTYSMAYVS